MCMCVCARVCTCLVQILAWKCGHLDWFESAMYRCMFPSSQCAMPPVPLATHAAMGVLGVRVVEGVNLANRDAVGKQDPYVLLKLSVFEPDGQSVLPIWHASRGPACSLLTSNGLSLCHEHHMLSSRVFLV